MSRNPNADKHLPKYTPPDCRAKRKTTEVSHFGGVVHEGKKGMNRKTRRRLVSMMKSKNRRLLKKNDTMQIVHAQKALKETKEAAGNTGRRYLPFMRKKEVKQS